MTFRRQYQQMSKILHTFGSSKSYTNLVSVELSNLVFFKTYNTKFDELSYHLRIKMVDL